MRMNQEERRFDFHDLGAALKRAREEKGWTQAYVAELVDRDSRTIMKIENKGQYPSFDLFVKLITMFDVSVDQFIHADGGAKSSSCRKHIDVLLNSMNEKELVVIEATAEGIKKARETEVPKYGPLFFFCAILRAVAKWQAGLLSIQTPFLRCKMLVGLCPIPFILHRSNAGCAFFQNASIYIRWSFKTFALRNFDGDISNQTNSQQWPQR